MPETTTSTPTSTALAALLTEIQKAGGSVAIHGPYEDLGLAICALISKAMEGQSPEVRATLWKQYLEAIAPWHQLGVKLADQITGWLSGLLKL
jgi:hypothetical protein